MKLYFTLFIILISISSLHAQTAKFKVSKQEQKLRVIPNNKALNKGKNPIHIESKGYKIDSVTYQGGKITKV